MAGEPVWQFFKKPLIFRVGSSYLGFFSTLNDRYLQTNLTKSSTKFRNEGLFLHHEL